MVYYGLIKKYYIPIYTFECVQEGFRIEIIEKEEMYNIHAFYINFLRVKYICIYFIYINVATRCD